MGGWNIKDKEVEQCKEQKQYWFILLNVEGFESVMLMYGTQAEMWNYMRNSLNYSIHYRYRAASDEEVMMARKLGMKAYIC